MQASFSYCWGENKHLNYIAQHGWKTHMSFYRENASYVGVSPSVAYERLVFAGRGKIGAEYMLRYYPERIKPQSDINLVLGFNF